MTLDAFVERERGRLGRRLTGIYARALIWYFLGMSLLWVVGFESIYGHPTPFYALYSPAFDTLFVPGFMAALIGAAYLVGSQSYLRRSRSRFLGSLAAWGTLVVVLAGLSRTAMESVRPLMWHLFAMGVFTAFLALQLRLGERADWSKGAGNVTPFRFLFAVIAFSILFSCAIAMLRNGPAGIAQAYQRETYEYVGDIGKTSSIRTLFTRYVEIMPYLSLHARAAPPGPIAVLWLLSYLVGRGAMALSLATIVLGSTAIVPLYFWARDLTNERAARTCCVVYALIPSIVLFTATSAEILFMPFTLTTLFLFDRAIRRNSVPYSLGAGVMFGVLALLKFTLLGIGAYFVIVGLWMLRTSEMRRNVVQTAIVMGLSCIAFHLLVRWWSGFDIMECFRAAKAHFDMDQTKLDQITPRLAGWVYRILNPVCWFYFAGIPVSVLFLWRVWRPEQDTKALFIVFALTLFTLNLLYLGRGEGERSALYVFPFLVLPAAHALEQLCRKAQSLTPLAATLAFLGFQCWLTETFFYTYW